MPLFEIFLDYANSLALVHLLECARIISQKGTLLAIELAGLILCVFISTLCKGKKFSEAIFITLFTITRLVVTVSKLSILTMIFGINIFTIFQVCLGSCLVNALGNKVL